VNEKTKPRKRIWVLNVDVSADELLTRLEAAKANGLDASQEEVAEGIRRHIDGARRAANRKDPIPRRFPNWWRGALVETAFRHLHAARTEMVDLYDANELHAEIPVAVARAQAALHRDDPRRVPLDELRKEPVRQLRPRLRRLIGDSYEALDGKHAQLRSFRNILLLSAALITILVGVTLYFVSENPTIMPFCFPNEEVTASQPDVVIEEHNFNCPTGSDVEGPTGGDVLIVALLGALGGALSASVSIRNLKGTSTAYDVPVALAFLKLPLGAFTAILALVAIRGDFVPGLSILDSQEQILAYALVFGFAQQILTRLLDQRAQTLLEELPGGTEAAPPHVDTKPAAPAEPDGPAAETDDELLGPLVPADLPDKDVDVVSSDEPDDVDEEEEDNTITEAVVADDEVVVPDPLTDQGDEFQDDDLPPDEPAAEGGPPDDKPPDDKPPVGDLQDADLQDAELQDSDLQDAELQDSDLQDAELQDDELPPAKKATRPRTARGPRDKG
jgi:hypothetical protein